MIKSNTKVDIRFAEKLNQDNEYSALCIYDISREKKEVVLKDKKKKKGIKSPDYDFDINAGFFTIPSNLNILIYNKKAELVVRNKIFEVFIRYIEMLYD